MSDKKRVVEVFTAACSCCDDALELVRSLACPSCRIEVLDMHSDAGRSRAREYGIHSVPAVVIEGRLADCCAGRAPDRAALRSAGVGVPLG